MPNRKILISTLGLASSLVFLAIFILAPSQSLRFVAFSAPSESTIANSSSDTRQPTSFLSTAISPESVLVVDALRSETEEQDLADPLDEPRISFLNPRSFRNDTDRQLIVPRSILSHYPLRC